MKIESNYKKLMIGVCSFIVIGIIGIVYAAFTGNLNITGPAGAKPRLGWLYQLSRDESWTVSPDARDYSFVYYVSSFIRILDVYIDDFEAVHPVAYLIPDIQFEGNHTGSSSDHYRMKI